MCMFVCFSALILIFWMLGALFLFQFFCFILFELWISKWFCEDSIEFSEFICLCCGGSVEDGCVHLIGIYFYHESQRNVENICAKRCPCTVPHHTLYTQCTRLTEHTQRSVCAFDYVRVWVRAFLSHVGCSHRGISQIAEKRDNNAHWKASRF